jgi:hypothetical protein
MDEIEYHQMQEDAAIAANIGKAVRAILNHYDATTLARLQRNAYKYSDCGVSVSFRLYDGTYIWNGDSRALDPAMVDMVEDICISSIVEGSDAEVEPFWLDIVKLADGSDRACEKYPDDSIEQLALRRSDEAIHYVESEAHCLWVEANEECDDGD